MECNQDEKTCGKCDAVLEVRDKVVTCFTCKQDFHTRCEHVSDQKHEILSDQNDGTGIVWFCRTCRRTTATMLSHIANLEMRLKTIEVERDKERHEVTVLQNLVRALNKKLNSIEDLVHKSTENNEGEIETIKEAVTTMLSEIPQTTSIEERFSSIEDSLNQLSLLPSVDQSRICLANSSDSFPVYTSFSNQNALEVSTLQVSNELSDRQRRRNNVVFHNIPESENPENDVKTVFNICREVLGEVPEMQSDLKTNKARLYRMGKKVQGKNRTIKCHFTSQDDCEQLLAQSRILKDSTSYSRIIIQADLTPMQRSHIKQLVLEKKRRNKCAQENDEEADWVLRNGKLCRKRDNM